MSVFSKINEAVFGRKVEPRGIVRGPARPPHYPLPGIDIAPRFKSAPVDAEAVLIKLAAEHPQKLNWRDSIIDMMTLVGLEGNLSERRELASELGYQGDGKDTLAMDKWLHNAVMNRLLNKRGKVLVLAREPDAIATTWHTRRSDQTVQAQPASESPSEFRDTQRLADHQGS